jgi:hypothetical protein
MVVLAAGVNTVVKGFIFLLYRVDESAYKTDRLLTASVFLGVMAALMV